MLKDFRKPRSYYDVLKIQLHVTDTDVRKAYCNLLASYENEKAPQKRLNALRIRLLNEAYAALRTQDNRNRYNRLLLSSLGKPKGFSLKPDNDNFSISNDRGLWNKLTDFLTTSKHNPEKKDRENG